MSVPASRPATGFTFLPAGTTPGAYAALLSGGPSLPVIDPGDSARSARWSAILRNRVPAEPAAVYAVALTATLEPVAAALRKRGRGAPTATAILTDRNQLGVRVAREMHRRFARPAFLTGADFPALTFMIAKWWSRAASKPQTETLLIEKLAERRPICIAVRRGKLAKLDRCDIPELLRRRCRTLVFMAHGEGAHLNLGDTALCSGIAFPPHEATSPVDRLCGIREAGPRCRKASAAQRLVSPADLAAENVVIASCNTSAMCGELYPTAHNLVLAALDGAPRTVVAPSALCTSTVWDIELIMGELMRDPDPHRLCEAMNDLQRERDGFTSWAVFGAPSL